jgi:uncharacterized membrane protein
MTSRLAQSWQDLRESLWFVPALLVTASFALAYGLIQFDAHTNWQGEKQFPLLFGNGAEGARGMLTAIAGSMLTVAALTFSLTLSAISQVSSQYSPRVLRNFMRDRGNQVVMGYFVGVFAYCLIVLGTIRGTDEQKFVPATAVLVGLVLALGGVAALIFFIHHIAESLQTGTIVRRIYAETSRAINTLFPDTLGESVGDQRLDEAARRFDPAHPDWHPVRAGQTGYLQSVSVEGLLHWATRHRVLLRLEEVVGAFVTETTVLLSVRGDADPAKTDDLLDHVSIGPHRNLQQDAAFGLQQLVDIALKALSPGINDTTTAIMAVDYLGALMVQLAGRGFPSPVRSDGQHARVLVRAAGFDDYARLAFDLPRVNAHGNHAVLMRLLRALASTAAEADPTRRVVLRQQVGLLRAQADQTLQSEYEKTLFRNLHDALSETWAGLEE